MANALELVDSTSKLPACRPSGPTIRGALAGRRIRMICHRDHSPVRMHQLCSDRGRQPSAHAGQRVVQEQRVRLAAAVVAREPELVHAVIEAQEIVLADRAYGYKKELAPLLAAGASCVVRVRWTNLGE